MYKKITIITLVMVLLAAVALAGYNYGPKMITAGCDVKASCCTCEKCTCDDCSCAKGSCCSEKCCKCGQDCKCENCKCKAGTCK